MSEAEREKKKEKELSCKKKWLVINFWQNENWSPKLKIEETGKNVNEDDQKKKTELLLVSTKKTFLWSRKSSSSNLKKGLN